MTISETEEILPLVDDRGNVIGKALRSQCHSDRTLLHPVVHLHVFNPKGELYLQKRALTKRIQTETHFAPKGQKPIAQGSALGTIAAIEGSP